MAGGTGKQKQSSKQSSKQAVVVIHGMGEQRPMETLRGFVRAIWMDDYEFCRVVTGGLRNNDGGRGEEQTAEEARAEIDKKRLGSGTWITPATGRLVRSSVIHENIRITTDYHECGDKTVRARPMARTDFYEFYWADLMNGAANSALRRWTAGLFLRRFSSVPVSVFAMWVGLWIAVIVMAMLFLLALPQFLPLPVRWLETPLEGFRDDIYNFVARQWPDDPAWTFAVLAALPVLNMIGVFLRDQFVRPTARSAIKLGPAAAFHLFVVLSIAIIIALCSVLIDSGTLTAKTLFWSLAALLALLIGYLVNAFYIPYFGDVARYVQSATDTVEQREHIRARGLSLLRQLHDDPEYGRIVIAAHSLGSVVAYDLIRLLWNEYGPTSAGGFAMPQPVRTAFHAVADAAPPAGSDTGAGIGALKSYRAAQKQAFVALRDAQLAAADDDDEPAPVWKISDLVTFGSPLTHAEFLMASDGEHLDALQEERSLPRNPPIAETGANAVANPSGGPTYLYWAGSRRGRSGTVHAHHATPYCVVRWSNIHDWRRWAFLGDLVSGPLAPHFGRGIADFNVSIRRLSRKFFENSFVTHTLYWRQWAEREAARNADTIYGRKRQDVHAALAGQFSLAPRAGSVGREPVHLRLLRAAVDLKFGQDLLCDTQRLFGVTMEEAEAAPQLVLGGSPTHLLGRFLSALVPRLVVGALLAAGALAIYHIWITA